MLVSLCQHCAARNAKWVSNGKTNTAFGKSLGLTSLAHKQQMA
jgi:hypothetical protein